MPPPLAGKLTVSVRFTWHGDAQRGAQLLAPLRACAPAIIDTVDLIPSTALGQVHSDPTDPMPLLEDHVLLEELTHDTVETLLGQVAASPALAMVEVRRLGGALAWHPRHASAISHRDAPFSLFAAGLAIPPLAELVPAQLAAVMTAVQPWSRGRTLVNFAPLTRPERVTSAYDPATMARLRRVAAHHDPHGILRARRFLDA
ncbi:hypothetical protein [Cellulomonas sp. WB94]|uniref:hypothetical protein n=1 Tax=Cellulomonas sp. WB94 TaxID=2173174 RepID=UPI0013049BB2|nr:hypothetical protein [Cellulomonas sp. WB94]